MHHALDAMLAGAISGVSDTPRWQKDHCSLLTRQAIGTLMAPRLCNCHTVQTLIVPFLPPRRHKLLTAQPDTLTFMLSVIVLRDVARVRSISSVPGRITSVPGRAAVPRCASPGGPMRSAGPASKSPLPRPLPSPLPPNLPRPAPHPPAGGRMFCRYVGMFHLEDAVNNEEDRLTFTEQRLDLK